MLTPFLVVAGCTALCVVGSHVYFRQWAIKRPPAGVMNLGDVVFMLAAIVAVPYLYLALPRWVAAALLLLAALSILPSTLQPVVRRPAWVWAATLVLLGFDIYASLHARASQPLFLAVNDAALVLLIVGVANLWAQSGMRARDAAVLAAGLVVYDFVATSQMTLMNDLIRKLSGMPLAPMVAWQAGAPGQWLGVGLGDLLLCSVFPLVMRKAYGRTAATAAMLSVILVAAAMLGLLAWGFVRVTIPAMVALGPLMVAQVLYWRHRSGEERTMRLYRQQEAPAAGTNS